jgi:hypothetical protein
LSFVFNNLSNIKPVLYYSEDRDGEEWKKVEGDIDDGGASTGKYPGFLYLKNRGTEKAEINVAYTTFNDQCKTKFISGNPDDYINLEGSLRRLNCYFNGINGIQKVKLYSNNTLCDCKGFLYPKAPVMVSLFHEDLDFVNDQGSIQFAGYRCEHTFRRSDNYLSVTSDTKVDFYVHSAVSSNPQFYPKITITSNLALILSLSIGIPVGIILIAVLVCAIASGCCSEMLDDCCSCSCGPCDLQPARMKDKVIVQYSYSDDRPVDVPEYEGPALAV